MPFVALIHTSLNSCRGPARIFLQGRLTVVPARVCCSVCRSSRQPGSCAGARN